MSTWIHVWGPPFVAMGRDTEGVPFATARQGCERCGTQRNPFTLVPARRDRASNCRDNPAPVPVRDYSAELEQVRETLKAYKADGIRVESFHSGRTPRPDPRELAYGR